MLWISPPFNLKKNIYFGCIGKAAPNYLHGFLDLHPQDPSGLRCGNVSRVCFSIFEKELVYCE